MNDRNRTLDAARQSWNETEQIEEETERDNVINGVLANVEDPEPETEDAPDAPSLEEAAQQANMVAVVGVEIVSNPDDDAKRATERFLHDMGETPSNV